MEKSKVFAVLRLQTLYSFPCVLLRDGTVRGGAVWGWSSEGWSSEGVEK